MRILVVRFSAIGDCVMAAWAVTALRQALPQAEIVWAAQTECAPVVLSPGLADRVYAVPRQEWKARRWAPTTWTRQLRAYLGLRGAGFDLGFDFQGHSKTALLVRLSGCRRALANRATDSLARALLKPVTLPDGLEHEVEKGLALVSEFAPDAPERPLMPPADAPGPEPWVTIQTGAGEARKAYPPGQWAEVAARLAAGGCRVRFLGAAGDPSPSVPGVESSVGRLTLREAMAEVAASSVHVAADTGTGHIAAAYGVPVVSVFGPTDPARFRPFTPAGTVLRSATPGGVPPSDVADAVLARLGVRLAARAR